MVSEGDINAASTINVRVKGGKKNCEGKRDQISNDKMLLDPTPNEVLTSHPPSTTKPSDDELGEEVIDVTAREKWVTQFETARQAWRY